MKLKVGDLISFRCDRFIWSDGEERSGHILRIEGDVVETTGGSPTDMREVKRPVWNADEGMWVVPVGCVSED
jgi:hypothetical protein